MDRREFLRKSAMLGGAAALGRHVPGAWAGEGPRTTPIPTGSLIHDYATNPADSPIDTVVVLMMENRSVDHYLGWLADDRDFRRFGRRHYHPNSPHLPPGFPGWSGFDGNNDQSFTNPDGASVDTFYLPHWADQENPYRGCGHPDPGHGWTSGYRQWNGGANDGFLADGSGNDEFAIGYYLANDIPAYADYARRFTTFDRYFCSVLTSTFPNREYLHSAQSGGIHTNALPTPDNVPPRIPPDNGVFAFEWDNIWDRLQAAGMIPGVDAGYFFIDLPAILLWGERMLPFMQHAEDYFARCATGTLPRVTFIDPGFTTGLRTDDHPYADIRAGQKLVADYVKAFVDSPHWENGVFFVTYDEWGGFFDHVAPPTLPDDFAGVPTDPDQDRDGDLNNGIQGPGFEQAGFRVPTMMLSPYARPGFVDHRTYDHTSILRFLEWRFLGAPADTTVDPSTLPITGNAVPSWALTQRDATAFNIGASLGSADPNPDIEVPLLPEVPITSAPCEGEELEGAFGPVTGVPHEVWDAVHEIEDNVPAPIPLEEQEHAFEQAMKAGFFERVGFDARPYLSRKVPTL